MSFPISCCWFWGRGSQCLGRRVYNYCGCLLLKHWFSCELKLPRWSHFCQGNKKMKQRDQEECLTRVPPSTFLCELLSFFTVPELYLLLAKKPNHQHFFLWKKPTTFVHQHSSFAYWAWPITTKLARILHLHKKDWIKNSPGNLAFKPCLLCSPQSTI